MSQASENKLKFNKRISPKSSQYIDNLSADSDGSRDDVQTFQQSSRLMFFVSKFFGYSLFELPKINLKNHKICRKFKIKTTFVDFTILVAVVTTYLSLIYYNTVTRFEMDHSQSLILMVGGHICLVIGLVVATAAILLCYVRRETVFRIFINLCYIDILLEKFYDTLVMGPLNKREKNFDNFDSSNRVPHLLNHKNHLRFSILFLVVGVIIICLDVAATYVLIEVDFNSNPFVYVSYALQNASFFMITAQTVLFLLVIKTRYAALNKLICCYLTIQDSPHNPDVEELYDLENIPDSQLANSTFLRNGFRFDRRIIAEFAQIHDKLNDIVEWINCCYAVQCLGVIAVSFGYVILTFFALYYALFRPTEETSQLAFVYLVWFIFYAICVLSLIIASWSATSEGNTTGVLLHKSINQIMMDSELQGSQYNAIIDSLRIFSLQLQKRSPIVSCGLFTYDWTLLFSMVSASATYLIILIQFDSSMASLIRDTNKTGNAIN